MTHPHLSATSPSSAPRLRGWASGQGMGGLLRLIAAALAGALIGVLQEWSVLHLSHTLYPLSNTAAPFILVAFVVALSGRSHWEVVVLGIVSLVVAVVAFYVAQETRGWAVSRHQVVFWTGSAVVVGPLVGLAAGWVRHGRELTLSVGAGTLGGMLVGEAVHGLRFTGESTVAGYWYAELAVGVALAVAITLGRSVARRAGVLAATGGLAVTLGTCGVVAVGTYIVYQIP